MKNTVSKSKRSSPPVEPVIISRLQRATAAQIAQERARALWRQRAARILVNAVIAAVCLRVLAIAVQPCLAGYRSTRGIHTLRDQLHREAERHQHLQSQIQFLQSDSGVEEEARKLGWTRVGEVALQIVTPEPPSKPLPAVSAEPAKAVPAAKLPSRVSVSERIRLTLTRWLEHGKGKK
jgi:cell division protein FtsL